MMLIIYPPWCDTRPLDPQCINATKLNLFYFSLRFELKSLLFFAIIPSSELAIANHGIIATFAPFPRSPVLPSPYATTNIAPQLCSQSINTYITKMSRRSTRTTKARGSYGSMAESQAKQVAKPDTIADDALHWRFDILYGVLTCQN